MRTIYLDGQYNCHGEDDGTMTPVQTEFFDGKCDYFIAGYRYDTRSGRLAISPQKPYDQLLAVQRQYEQDRAELENIVDELYGQVMA